MTFASDFRRFVRVWPVLSRSAPKRALHGSGFARHLRPMDTPGDQPRVTILLASYNGAAHLAAQLASFRAQEHSAWDLWVSDDGSTDGTVALLKKFRSETFGAHDVRLLRGPERGSTANFLSLLTHPELPAGPGALVAISDQDDVWHAHKLSRAVAALKGQSGAVLYGAQSLHVDAALRPLGPSKPPRRPPSFGNALCETLVSGHSAVLNAEALALVRAAGCQDVPFHDWWLGQLVTGCGGRLLIDSEIVLDYRRHGANVLGPSRGVRAAMARGWQVMNGTYGRWMAANRAALRASGAPLTDAADQALTVLETAPMAGPGRLRALRAAGLCRQSAALTRVVEAAGVLGRL